jgi:hypothetical protein
MARTDPQFNLRVPQELKQQVARAAIENGRSINTEAVYRLIHSFEKDEESLENIATEALMKELVLRYSKLNIVLTIATEDK